MAAFGHLRREAPQLRLGEAKAYLDAVRRGAEPADDLLQRTRPAGAVRFQTVAGPADAVIPAQPI